MTTSTGLAATVDVASDANVRRIGPRSDAADVRVSSGAPVRLALLVCDAGPHLAAGRAAALAGCADLVLTLRADARTTLIERAAALRDARPDAVLLLVDPGEAHASIDLAEALRLGCETQDPLPSVLLSGDERTRARVVPSLGALPAQAVPDATTPGGREAIAARVRAMRREGAELVLRDEAIEAAARALAAALGRTTLVVDVSGATTSLAYATPAGGVSAVHGPVGVGVHADRLVVRGGLDRVRRWVPRAIDAPALLERVFNRARWPDAVPASVLALSVEMSLAREAISFVLTEAVRAGIGTADMRAAQAIVCTGDLAHFPRAAQTVLVAIDALAPEGTQLIARERSDSLIAAGATIGRASTDVVGAIEPLAIVTTMWPRRAAAVKVTDATGAIDARVTRGAFMLVPTSGAVDLVLPGVGTAATAATLALGVVIDARGRPLEIPPRDAERLPTIARWTSALGALPPEAVA